MASYSSKGYGYGSNGTTKMWSIDAEYTTSKDSANNTTLTISKVRFSGVSGSFSGHCDGLTIAGSSVSYKTTNLTQSSSNVNVLSSSWSKKYTASTSSQSVSVKVKFSKPGWGDGKGATTTVKITVPALPSYKITYNGNGATSGSMSATTKYYGKSVSLTANAFSKTGYTFVGWSTNSTATSATYADKATYPASNNANITLYAIWKKTITLTYNANGGSTAPSAQSATVYNSTTSSNFTISNAVLTKPSWRFAGWSTSSNATTAQYTANQTISLSANTTLYAVWVPAEIILTFDSNGGNPNTTLPGGGTLTNLQPDGTFKNPWTLTVSTKPEKTYYTFLGWSTSKTATSPQYAVDSQATFTESAKLYAVWSHQTATQYFYGKTSTSENTVVTTQTVYRDAKVTLPTVSGVANKYEFLGWTNSTTYGKSLTAPVVVTYDTNKSDLNYLIQTVTLSDPAASSYNYYGVYRDVSPSKATLNSYETIRPLTNSTEVLNDFETYVNTVKNGNDYPNTTMEYSNYIFGYLNLNSTIDLKIENKDIELTKNDGEDVPFSNVANSVISNNYYIFGIGGFSIDVNTPYILTLTGTAENGKPVEYVISVNISAQIIDITGPYEGKFLNSDEETDKHNSKVTFNSDVYIHDNLIGDLGVVDREGDKKLVPKQLTGVNITPNTVDTDAAEYELVGEAYAVYDSSTKSLTFFRDTAGSYTDEQVVDTKTYYTGIESEEYKSNSAVPWYSNRANITKVIFEDFIKPQYTAYWFYNLNKLVNFANIEYLDTSNVTNMRYMFYSCSALTSLDVSHFDTSNVTNMNHMFYNCSSLTSLDVSHFDTSSVIDMRYMFYNCKNLTSLDVSRFDTSSVINMSFMFGDCYALTSLDVSHFDTSNVTDMSSMFSVCKNLTSLDVSHFDTSSVTNMSYMFNNCYALTSLDVSHFDTSNVTDTGLMFFNCWKLDNVVLFILNMPDASRMFADCSIDSSVINGVYLKKEEKEPETDLTNSTWELYANVDTSLENVYDINFDTADDFAWNGLSGNSESLYYHYSDGAAISTVYTIDDGWINESYKTITITGGEDVTNPDLINWLKNNANYVESVNLAALVATKSSNSKVYDGGTSTFSGPTPPEILTPTSPLPINYPKPYYINYELPKITKITDEDAQKLTFNVTEFLDYSDIDNSPIELTNNSPIVVNPTSFESESKLKIMGYGDITVNGSTISVGTPMGLIPLDEINGEVNFDYETGNISLAYAGDFTKYYHTKYNLGDSIWVGNKSTETGVNSPGNCLVFRKNHNESKSDIEGPFTISSVVASGICSVGQYAIDNNADLITSGPVSEIYVEVNISANFEIGSAQTKLGQITVNLLDKNNVSFTLTSLVSLYYNGSQNFTISSSDSVAQFCNGTGDSGNINLNPQSISVYVDSTIPSSSDFFYVDSTLIPGLNTFSWDDTIVSLSVIPNYCDISSSKSASFDVAYNVNESESPITNFDITSFDYDNLFPDQIKFYTKNLNDVNKAAYSLILNTLDYNTDEKTPRVMFGEGLEVVNQNQTAIGKYNDSKPNDKVAFYIGNGNGRDLTNTTWVFNDELIEGLVGEFDIQYTSDNRTFNTLYLLYDSNNVFRMRYVVGPGNWWPAYNSADGWNQQAFKTITITGGDDVTNSTLISWLDQNADLESGDFRNNLLTVGYDYETILSSNEANTNPLFATNRTDTNIGVATMVGSGGYNRGLYQWTDFENREGGSWMIYQSGNGINIPTAPFIAGHSSAIGTIKDGYNSAAVSLASSTWKAICSVSLEAGVWIVNSGARWPNNTTGRRKANVTSTSGGDSMHISVAPVNGDATQVRWDQIVSLGSTTTLYLNMWQNSGSSMSIAASGAAWGSYIRAVRII